MSRAPDRAVQAVNGERPSTGVAIVEDHLALRRGLELLLQHEGCTIVALAGSASEAFEMIRKRRPDVSLVDLSLPDETGVSLVRRLLEEDPDAAIVIFTGVQDADVLAEALDTGARGFVLKSAPPAELIRAVHTVADGGSYVDPALHPLILSRSTTDRIPVLSPREREVLGLLALGLTGEQIAEQLVLSPETVRTHVRNAMEKLEAQTRVHAIAIALREGELRLAS